MTTKACVVVGNPKPRSRTLTVATTLVEHVLDPGTYDLTVIDLADHIDEIFTWPSETLGELNALVADSDLVVFASPTYKATYTGLLKAFLDRYPANGLAGVVAIPVLTIADGTHSMAPTHNVAPLLAELGAIVPGRGFAFVSAHMDRLDEIVEAAASEYRANIARVAALAPATAAVAS
ncbi:NAD(P)H-dependent oxidoreductase [Microbacterium sp. 10M-3C3]|jgi:FMN reductase|uniref:NADPH-dependent FMN reductase n=1 Tax=Microbacterium sp. 10M-3C3 TaxID=2483401 RepID=UPI000F63522F|nr:NAD(P)H-dependent oxidoreductase [Microbacterium sp. 10M-3C3]